MSAQVFPPQTYTRAQRRHPLASAAPQNHQQQPATPPKGQQQQKKKDGSSPPLPRQNSKITPPSPPKVIHDKTTRSDYQRVGFLGEGGFARVYEVRDTNGLRSACKVVTKSSLKTKKAKTKLYAEIKIHRSLEHPNIVSFRDCFEDDENVYMTLELCQSGSLMDMLRRRRRFTDPEARFFMVQLIGACHYMHTHQVIHRDLKLGNLFLDGRMNIKVGDFGLAALIENPGERKKTICGTPNYIAPEVLFDTANGHSFEVDTWSIGVILYTLAVGRPPFQTKEVKAIYKRIRDNDYEFPGDRNVSPDVKELVQSILTQKPEERPSLHEIIDHVFFTLGTFPPYIPASAYDTAPDFRNINRSSSEMNYRKVRRQALLDEDQTSIAVPKPPSQHDYQSKSVTSSLAQQEKEFQKAVQPGSPISALLSSARQPLVMAPNANGSAAAASRESPLFRKLQAASRQAASPLGPGAKRGLQGIQEEDVQMDEKGRKELEAHKARIVSQMAPNREEDTAQLPTLAKGKGKEIAPIPTTRSQVDRERGLTRERENMPPVGSETRRLNQAGLAKSTRSIPPAPTAEPRLKVNAFDAAAQVLTIAFDAKAQGKVFRDPREDPRAPLPVEKVFIVSWVDYCNKYGMAYALTDGSVGVYFNDSTTLVLSADKRHFDYITSRRHGSVLVRKNHSVDVYPEDLKNKVYLLKHFERYIMDRLWGDHPYTFEDTDRTKGMDWVQKYLRMKHVIVFKLSHDILQFNFFDHSKLILSSHGLVVTYIDKNYKLSRWTLSDIMTHSFDPSGSPEEVKFMQRLVDKLKYCKEVLVSIHTASASEGSAPHDMPMGSALEADMKGSKASLR